MEIRRVWAVEIVSRGPEEFEGNTPTDQLDDALEQLDDPRRTWIEDQLQARGLEMLDRSLGLGIGSLTYEAKRRRLAVKTADWLNEVIPDADVSVYPQGGLQGHWQLMRDDHQNPWQYFREYRRGRKQYKQYLKTRKELNDGI